MSVIFLPSVGRPRRSASSLARENQRWRRCQEVKRNDGSKKHKAPEAKPRT